MDVNQTPAQEPKTYDVSKLEAGALLGLAAYGGFSLIKGGVRKIKAWHVARAEKKLAATLQQTQPAQQPAQQAQTQTPPAK